MLEFLKQFKEKKFDILFFLPSEKENNIIVFEQELKEPGTKLDGSENGDCYYIILFKHLDDEIKFLDKFEAILTSPLDYISMLIPDDWYGLICKKTTTSGKFAQEAFDNIKEHC